MATEVKLPLLGENLAGGDVVDIKVAVGDSVTAGQTLLEVDAEKSTLEVPSPVAGKIQKLLVKKGDAIKVHQALFLIEEVGDGKPKEAKQEAPPAKPAAETPKASTPEPAKPAAPAKAAPPKPAAEPAGNGKAIAAGPATRQLARELGVDLARVTGTGPSGRVTQDDVKTFVQQALANPSTPPGPPFCKGGRNPAVA